MPTKFYIDVEYPDGTKETFAAFSWSDTPTQADWDKFMESAKTSMTGPFSGKVVGWAKA